MKIPHDTKQRIRKIAINNGWNTHIFQILREKHDGNFLFNGNLLSRLPKPVELSYEWVKINFNYQEPEFYSIFFDESENGLFDVPSVHINKYEK